MGKYDAFRPQYQRRKAIRIHPVWRGIGFVFMVIMPVVAYFATTTILIENQERNWFRIPRDLIASGGDPYLYMKIIGTIAIVFVSYAIFMMITFVMYRIFGPSRLGPLDAPQKAFRGKTYRR